MLVNITQANITQTNITKEGTITMAVLETTEKFHSENEEGTQPTLRNCVESSLRNYFQQLDGLPVTGLYELVLAEIESPLMEAVMDYTRGNQTQASKLLGLNRGTLRKKLKTYGLN